MPTKRTIWKKRINLRNINISKLNKKETENLNRLFTTNKIKAVIKNFQQTKVPDWMASQ